MTKTIKICDKCGREVNWLFEFHHVEIKGLRIELREYDKHDLCKECAEKFVDMYNNYAKNTKEVSF